MSKIDILVLSASAAILLSACGDENTYVTQGNDTSVVPILESGKKLSKQYCDDSNAGSQLYVKDSSSMYFCDGEDWVSMKGEKGDKGDTGKTGASGKDGTDGDDGTSCTAKKIEKDNRTGYILTCGKDVVDTLWDGKNGQDGKDGVGKDGSSCTTEAIKDGYKVICGGDSVGVVKNGEKGKQGNQGDDGKSAYEIAKENGFDGSEEEWLESLKADAIYGQFVDERDGQLYRTVRIGDQVWMAENLNYGDSVQTPSLKGATWCGGGFNQRVCNCSIYGRLYTWAAAVNKPEDVCGYEHECNLRDTVQGICPDGWHLPDTTEFRTLWNAVGGMDFAGTLLRSTNGWVNDSNGTDAYGFSALPAGYRNYDGAFGYVGEVTIFWSSTYADSYYAYHMDLYYKIRSTGVVGTIKRYGYSVRCIKDN